MNLRDQSSPWNLPLPWMFALLILAISPPANGCQLETGDDLAAAIFDLPELVRGSVAKVRPSLVTIESFGGVTTRQGEIGGIRKQGEGNTTGVVVSEDGLVLTSRFNFANQPRIISVLTAQGERKTATMVAQDMTRNLCLLKVKDAEGLQVPTWVPAEEVEVGRYAISVGVGYGDTQPAVSLGIISAKNRIFGRALQTDANISPANYGGPLMDIEGRIYGICVPLSPRGMSAVAGTEWYDSGIGFVIPLTDTPDWLQKLKDGQSIFPGSLGLTVADTEDGVGLKIHQVIKGFPAEQAGLAKDDILLQADGKTLNRQSDLLELIRRMTAEQSIKLVYCRADEKEKEITVEVSLARHPDTLPKSLIPGLPPLEELR